MIMLFPVVAFSKAEDAGAPVFSSSDCDCVDLTDMGMNTSGGPAETVPSTLHCQYVGKGTEIFLDKTTIPPNVRYSIIYYSTHEEALSNFQIMTNTYRGQEDSKHYRVIQTQDTSSRYSYLGCWQLKPNASYYFGTRVILYKEKYYIEIGGDGNYTSDKRLQSAFDKVEACAEAAIDRNSGAEKQPTITITHVHPFSKEALRNAAKGGDIIATLKDANNRPMAGKDVYFFIMNNRLINLSDDALAIPVMDQEIGSVLDSSMAVEIMSVDSWSRFVKVTTDANGIAQFNYLKNGYINWENLEKLIKGKGSIFYTVFAYVFNEDPLTASHNGQKVQKIAYAQTQFNFSGVAVIKEVTFDDQIQVKKLNSEQIVDVTHYNVPYALIPGDEIRLKYGYIPIYWLSGEKLMIFPKKDYLEKGHEYATFTIGSKDMGLYHRITMPGCIGNYIKNMAEVLHVTFEGVEMIFEGPLYPLIKIITISGGCYGIEEYIESGEQVTMYPIGDVLIEEHSLILVDFYKDATVYTIEGSATVYNKNGSFVNVTTGEKMNITVNGTLGQIHTFNQDQFDDTQKKFINYAKETFGQSDNSGVVNGTEYPVVLIGGIVALLGVAMLITVVVYKRKRR